MVTDELLWSDASYVMRRSGTDQKRDAVRGGRLGRRESAGGGRNGESWGFVVKRKWGARRGSEGESARCVVRRNNCGMTEETVILRSGKNDVNGGNGG